MEIKKDSMKFRRNCFFSTVDELNQFVEKVERNPSYKVVLQGYDKATDRFFAVVEETL